MKVDQVESVMMMLMMNQMSKSSSSKDNPGFQVMLESILQASKSNESIEDLLKGMGMDLSTLGYGQGTSLDYDKIQNISKEIGKNLKSDNGDIEDAIEKASEKYGIDSKLIRALIKQESDFNVYEKSYAGAMGLMQLMPENVEHYGISDPYNVYENIDGGTRHLRDYLNLYNGNKALALAAYNAGPGTLQQRGVTTVDDIAKLPWETRTHVKKVLEYYGK